MTPPKTLTVYCSSSDKLDPPFYAAATEFGREMARRGHTLCYGGGRTGLMGAVARGVHSERGRVIGVVPGFLRHVELVYEQADELIITADMRSRKAEMERRADAFVVLPGGLGTLEELAEILSLKVLRQLHKPLVLFNQGGFYDPLLAFFAHLVQYRFAHAASRTTFDVATTVPRIFAALEKPPDQPSEGADKGDLWMVNRPSAPRVARPKAPNPKPE